MLLFYIELDDVHNTKLWSHLFTACYLHFGRNSQGGKWRIGDGRVIIIVEAKGTECVLGAGLCQTENQYRPPCGEGSLD